MCAFKYFLSLFLDKKRSKNGSKEEEEEEEEEEKERVRKYNIHLSNIHSHNSITGVDKSLKSFLLGHLLYKVADNGHWADLLGSVKWGYVSLLLDILENQYESLGEIPDLFGENRAKWKENIIKSKN